MSIPGLRHQRKRPSSKFAVLHGVDRGDCVRRLAADDAKLRLLLRRRCVIQPLSRWLVSEWHVPGFLVSGHVTQVVAWYSAF